jgi:hypothetical protein
MSISFPVCLFFVCLFFIFCLSFFLPDLCRSQLLRQLDALLVRPLVSSFVCLSIYLSLCLSNFMSVYLSVCLSVYLICAALNFSVSWTLCLTALLFSANFPSIKFWYLTTFIACSPRTPEKDTNVTFLIT